MAILLTSPVSSKRQIESRYLDVVVREGVRPPNSFSITLPKGWALRSTAAGHGPSPETPLVQLARFSPGEASAPGAAEQAEIIIWAAHLPRELHGADWLREWSALQGLTTHDSRQVPTAFGAMADTLASGRDGQVTLMRRLTTVKDGAVLYVIDGRVPLSPTALSPQVQEIFLLAVTRFRLLEPTGAVFAEPFERVFLGGAVPVGFLASGLWHREPGAEAPEGGGSMILYNMNEALAAGALVAVSGPAGSSAAAIEAATLEKLSNQGLHLDGPGEPLGQHVVKGAELTLTRIGGERDGGALTVLCARWQWAHAAVLILISAAEEADFQAWAINRRAFEIAVNSLS